MKHIFLLMSFIFMFFSYALDIKNVPYYKKLSDDVYFRILNLPGGLKKGEIFLKDNLVIEVASPYEKMDVIKITFFVAGRLQLLLDKGIKPENIGIERLKDGAYITVNNEKLISFYENDTKLRYKLSAFKLAFIFACKIKNALGDKKKYILHDFSRAYKYLNRGDEYFANNSLDNAYYAYRKAWKMDGKYSIVYYSMGVVAYNNRNYKEALEFLEKSVNLSPYFSRAYYFIALTSMVLKDYERALVSIRLAIRYNNTSDLYANLMADILSELKNKNRLYSVEVNLSDI